MKSKVGSFWGIWDLQVQTILDDNYIELSKYYNELKNSDEDKWNAFCDLVGEEQDVLLYDSKEYFNTGKDSITTKCKNYAKTLLSFLQIYNPRVRCLGITDHNYLHGSLLEGLLEVSESFECKIIPGVEVNVSGIHCLILFSLPPCEANDFSEGIRSFLAQIGITTSKNNGSLRLATIATQELLDKVEKEHGILIFPHCNSSNGLFQERTKSDRTYLADIFNHRSPIILQSKNLDSIKKTTDYIESNEKLNSIFISTISPDSRSLKDIGSSDKDGNYCFIKGAPSFEGLRQAIFEPNTRIHLGKSPPIPPIHRIEKIVTNFPNNTYLNEDLICLRGKNEIEFNPNFTCIIGGRGTGKSTILNLLHEKLFPGQNEFLKDKRVTVDGSLVSIENYVEIDRDQDKKQIDYLSQNQIEKFASDSISLTHALYSRIEKINGAVIKKAKEETDQALEIFDKYLFKKLQLQEIQSNIVEFEKKKETENKIIKSFESKEYKSISNHISEKSEEYNQFVSAKESFIEISESVENLIGEHSEEVNVESNSNEKYTEYSNIYATAVKTMISHLRQGLEVNKEFDLENANNQEQKLENELLVSKTNLTEFLRTKGLEEDSLQDITDAAQQVKNLEGQIREEKRKEKQVKVDLEKLDISVLKKARTKYETNIGEIIDFVNSNVGNLNKQVKKIELEYVFNLEECHRELFSEFIERFGIDPGKMGTKRDKLEEALFQVPPKEVQSIKAFIAEICGTKKKKDLSQAQKILVELFSNDENFEIYKLIIDKNLNNAARFTKINVYYDGKILSDSSFGQRCTAALVLLLLLGNNPIVIDEPEGHLDSLLIANYLVELIKKSKQNRQIIFATHNANLVVNGDADLVYYLETDDKGITKITPLTLEDSTNREKLISLEGGRDAFKKRENKYKIQS